VAIYDLCKALHAIYIDRDRTQAARGGDFSCLGQFNLTPAERAAIEHKDMVTLYRLGAHPILLFHFSAVLNPRETFIRDVVPRIQGMSTGFYNYYELRRAVREANGDTTTCELTEEGGPVASGHVKGGDHG
jgi:hypothetical protein